MEPLQSIDNTTDDVLIESNENSCDLSQKGVKRVAKSPPEKDVKKAKLSGESSPKSIIEISEVSPQKEVPKTPKTPKISKEEREKLKKEKMEEREKQKEEKRMEKEKIAEEKRLEKEKREKEKLDKKLEEDRKKEEKRKEAEERKKKEEEEKMKKKREEEEKKEAKRKEEDEKKEAKKREEEAIEEKKRRESARFLGFFSKVEKKKVGVETKKRESISSWYLPFEPKDGMTMAPILSRNPLDQDFDIWKQNEQVTIQTFLSSAAKREPVKINEMKAKLFQFHDNRRPPYFGTWRKKSENVRGFCPLEEHEEGIDYEVDSDEEWEDEPSDCEECNSDDDVEKDNEEEDNEEDDGFFVPPCYLSDGEGEEDDDLDGDLKTSDEKKKKKTKRVTIDSDDEDGEKSNDAEERKARLASRASEWAKRTEKKKAANLVPRAIGPVYLAAERPAEFQFMGAVTFY